MSAVKGSQTSLCHITSDPKFIFIVQHQQSELYTPSKL